MKHALAIAGASTAAIAGGTLGYLYLADGTTPAMALQNASEGVRRAAASAVGAVNPVYRNEGSRATPAQIEAWCRKVGRTQGARGIREVPRVRTSPYLNAAFPLDLRGFAQAAGDGAGVGIKGGTVLAVLLSIETNAGISVSAACWNYNAGNFKLWRGDWHAEVTPECYFLVDRHPSLDFYPSFRNWESGIERWKTSTFGNSRYNQYGTMDALRAGDIRAFCRAIGRAGYARMYAASPRAMDARARRLAGLAPYTRNRAVIDGSQLFFNPAI